MAQKKQKSKSQSAHRSVRRIGKELAHLNPAKQLVFGYCVLMAFGWALLALPWAHEQPVAVIDSLFISVSAVSTTGLITVDPGSSFTLFGEIVILGLIQVGGIGYMAIVSLIVLSVSKSGESKKNSKNVTETEFVLPNDINRREFFWTVIVFTFGCEAAGAIILWLFFLEAGVSNPAWSAIFHAVSAFCTAGFSLNADSLTMFRDHAGVTFTISALSIMGAMGFLVASDVFQSFKSQKTRIHFTTRVIVKITGVLLLIGTVGLFLAEPSLRDLPPYERLLAAFFQAMSACTTVGFNSHPINVLSSSVIMLLLVLMTFGASPSGTGGGLKSTTLAVIWGLVRSRLRQTKSIQFSGRYISAGRVRGATSALSFFLLALFTALFLLFLTEPAASFDTVLFEAISAFGTVGLSLGITEDLSVLGKLIIIVLMTAGRVGIATFGIAIVSSSSKAEDSDESELLM